MTSRQPDIVFFSWDNLGWGEVGCYGGGVLRGAPTPRIDRLTADGLKLLNFKRRNAMHAQLLGGADRLHDPLGTHTVAITGAQMG